MHAEVAPVLVDRVRAVLLLGMVTTGISLVVDFQTGVFATIWLTKLAGMALYGCAAIAVSAVRGRSWRHTLAAVLPSGCLLTIVPGVIGIGLRNVNERLRVIYGTTYHLVLASEPGKGTRARVEIPELMAAEQITA